MQYYVNLGVGELNSKKIEIVKISKRRQNGVLTIIWSRFLKIFQLKTILKQKY